ncbi:MAG: hypothetical protein MB55_07260 [marine actinobacterium MedAcidi-G3]|nr:MAG: hypothetical protein MB55_07260 [marine actinobacterium MedAcidi-G3]MAR53390.1 hypothetical protein [Acidimicrobiaceae bacterium]MBA4812098.1 DsrE family protein [Acidimicrobiales bacterium]OUW86755.1 MAG: hypothetical protein CBD84_03235 [Acidimicrobiaceae bacterium TMED224]|tara:strand:- start:1310 stop:1702 length:393 start_codon:yes stop_codon:yes gene_type:complete
MAKNYFVQISTDPEVDPRKCVIGIACAAQAAIDGHTVDIFFASHAVRLLHEEFITSLDQHVSQETGWCKSMMQTLIDQAQGIYCSTGSQEVVGVTPDNAHEVLIAGLDLNWSGPPGVVALSSQADVVLTY